MKPIDISPEDMKTVRAILRRHLPDIEVRAFGSRVRWTARGSSDLDLALMTEDSIDAGSMADLREAFVESDLPFKVDLVDWATTSDEFRRVIEEEWEVVQEAKNVCVGAEWEIKTVEEISAHLPRSIAMGPFGSNIKTDNFVPTGVPVIRGQNLNAGRFNDSDFVFLTEEKADELAASNAFSGDLVFTHRGTLGQVGIIPMDAKYKRYVVSQSQMKLTCDRNQVNLLFILYFFRSPQGQYELLANTSTTGVPAISRPLTTLKSIKIPIPPLSQQRAIAHILGSLDDKIELNRRMNETLEAIAQAIFKSWFVDFDPVYENMKRKGAKAQRKRGSSLCVFASWCPCVKPGNPRPLPGQLRGVGGGGDSDGMAG